MPPHMESPFLPKREPTESAAARGPMPPLERPQSPQTGTSESKPLSLRSYTDTSAAEERPDAEAEVRRPQAADSVALSPSVVSIGPPPSLTQRPGLPEPEFPNPFRSAKGKKLIAACEPCRKVIICSYAKLCTALDRSCEFFCLLDLLLGLHLCAVDVFACSACTGASSQGFALKLSNRTRGCAFVLSYREGNSDTSKL